MRIYNNYMNELRKKRIDIGITQIQAANACGVSRRTYQNYESSDSFNDKYYDLLKKMEQMGVLNGENSILSIKKIIKTCRYVFSKYNKIKCAYLFGSYARNKAKGESDVDILIVCDPMGMEFYEIAPILEDNLHKKIDLHTHREMINNKLFIEEILTEGIKIYG